MLDGHKFGLNIASEYDTNMTSEVNKIYKSHCLVKINADV